MEDGQSPYDTEQVEDRMRQCGSLCVDTAHGRRNIGSNGGSNVFTEHHCRCHIELNPAHIEHNQGQCDSGAGGLEYQGQYRTEKQEQQNRSVAVTGPGGYESENLRSLLEVGNRTLHK